MLLDIELEQQVCCHPCISLDRSLPVCREKEFSYKDGAFALTSKATRMRENHRPKFDVLLTSYEFVSVDSATLSSIDWEVLIIDEAHRLKNNQSLVSAVTHFHCFPALLLIIYHISFLLGLSLVHVI